MKTKNKEVEIDKKRLKKGLYKSEFKTELDTDKSGYISLNIKITRDLQALMMSLAINEVRYDILQSIKKFKRYKHQKFISGSVSSETRSVIFNKELLDTGETTLYTEDIGTAERTINTYKHGFQTLLASLLKINQSEETNYKFK